MCVLKSEVECTNYVHMTQMCLTYRSICLKILNLLSNQKLINKSWIVEKGISVKVIDDSFSEDSYFWIGLDSPLCQQLELFSKESHFVSIWFILN